MKTALFLAALCAMGAACLHAASSSPITVDFSPAGGRILPDSAAINYGPDWAVATKTTGVTADLLLVTNPGENCAATQTLVSAASTAGATTLTRASVGAPSCRLILRTKSGGTLMGELVRDVSFGIASAPSAEARIDTADDKLGRALLAGEKPSLAYADWWTNGVASLRIDLTGQRRSGDTASRELFRADAPADGTFVWTSPLKAKGSYEASLRFFDASGGVIDTLVAAYEGFAEAALVLVVQ